MTIPGRGDFAADRRLLLLALIAVPIGAVSTVVARALLALIALFTNLFYYHEVSVAARAPALTYGLWTALVPVAGGLVIGLMARYGSERIRGHGIPEALEAILFGKSLMPPKVALLKPLSSAVSIGSGGPFGAEGPIIMTGGACGSLLGQLFHLTSAERKTLLVAGAAAGMAAIFGTPTAAVLLAVELLLFEWRPRSLVPVVVAAAVAAALRPYVLTGELPLFPLPGLGRVGAAEILAAFPVGIGAGAGAWLLSVSLYKVEDLFLKLPVHWSWWPALGGLAVGLGGLVEPRALGVGYDVIATFLQGDAAARVVATILVVKAAIWILALASGTSGGVLAPLLIIGSGLGALAAPYLPGPAALWPLAAMAAVMGGMMRSPFTAVIFAVELTDAVHALPVLLVAAVAAYGFTVLVMRRSILTEKVARRGYDIFREYGVDPLERLRVREIMTAGVETLAADGSASQAVALFQRPQRRHRGYPVVDGDGRLVGILTASDAFSVLPSDAAARVSDLLGRRPLILARPDDSCRAVAERMAVEGIGRLPVVDAGDPLRLVGIVTRSDLLKARRHANEDEHRREAPLRGR